MTIYANNDLLVIQVLPSVIIQEEEARQVLGMLDGMISGQDAVFH